ncbi:17730_t:CDS:1, partial [Funneliformis geosporum]
MGGYPKALSTTNKALILHPKNKNILILRSEIYYHQNSFKEVLKDLDSVIKLSPKACSPLCCQSEVHSKLKSYDFALDDINQALTIRASNPYAYEIRGIIYRKLGKYNEALNDFNKSLELLPLNATYLDSNDHNKRAKRNHSGCDEGYTLIFKMQGERNFASIYARRGATLLALERYDEPLSDLNQAFALQSEHLLALKKRACVYQSW